MKIRNLCELGAIVTTCVALSACGSDGSSSDSSSGTGNLSVSVTDAPIHDAQAVIVNFIGVVVKPGEGPALEFYFCKDPDSTDPNVDPPIVQDGECTDSDPHVESIDLLQQTDGVSAPLLDDVEIPAGKVNWVRLVLDDMPGEIVLSTGTFPLTVPSGSQNGLKLNRGFIVPEDGTTKIYIDFDVRKSIVEVHNTVPPSYKLKPTLRLVQEFGAIVGEVDAALMDTSCLGGSIYIFSGAGTTPDDIDRDEGDPVTSTLVKLDVNSTTGFSYHAGFLAPGDYTLAFVCADGVSQALGAPADEPADDPDQDDQLTFTVASETATVVDGQEERVDF